MLTVVSVLFSEPKIPQYTTHWPLQFARLVSVLFSEPKIPQCMCSTAGALCALRFSALQRAENSSMVTGTLVNPFLDYVSVLFSEPKIPQFYAAVDRQIYRVGFSALQRAENSSIHYLHCARVLTRQFQCSSASRKFLN